MDAFPLAEPDLVAARTVLRDYGNMSAASVFFVLKHILETGASGQMLMVALGPGFTAAFANLESKL